MSKIWFCVDCCRTGLIHCADPEHCGGMKLVPRQEAQRLAAKATADMPATEQFVERMRKGHKVPANRGRDDGCIHIMRHPDGCYFVVDADHHLRGPMKHSAALAITAWRKSGYIDRVCDVKKDRSQNRGH